MLSCPTCFHLRTRLAGRLSSVPAVPAEEPGATSLAQCARATTARPSYPGGVRSSVARCTWGLIVVASLALGGCATQTVSLKEGSREYVATDYENVLRQWTRTEQLISFSELDNFLTATATFESWDFRWAYVVRYHQDYRLTIAQRQKLLDKTLAETRLRHQFFVAIYGGERKYNELTRPESAWIVRLIDDTGNETAPQEIIAIKRPNAVERNYFPYNTAFRQAFRIRFPRVSGDGRPTISASARWFGLRFAGAQGNSELIWNLQDGTPTERRAVAAAR
jgi:hypothetical protein